jgi:hypothetical protein
MNNNNIIFNNLVIKKELSDNFILNKFNINLKEKNLFEIHEI